IKLTKELVKESTNQAPELALAVDLLWRAGETNIAAKTFKQLRAISSGFDLDTPLFGRLSPVADHLGLPADWRVQSPKRKDVGTRPSLDSLGPFRWEPYAAPAWTLTDADQRQHSLA